MSGKPRLALLGAFRFPVPQGSQAFLGEQARALAAAGAAVEIVTYGAGSGKVGPSADPIRSMTSIEISVALTPHSARSGPSAAKPLADLALARALARAHRKRPYRAVLAHNAEAVAVARLARLLGMRAPLVYVAHTLWQHEISAYLPERPALGGFLGTPGRTGGRAGDPGWLEGAKAEGREQAGDSRAAERGGASDERMRLPERAGNSRAARFGRAVDVWAARATDAVIALSECAARSLAANARGPVVCIPPGLERRPEPSLEEIATVCKQHRLDPLGFSLYSGNVDAYQDLGRLADLAPPAATAAIGERFPLVIATRDARGLPATLRAHLASRSASVSRAGSGAGVGSSRGTGIEIVLLRDEREARALRFGAGLHVIPRERPGGFPIKLLNAMESGQPILACSAIAETLEHERSAWLVGPGADSEAWRRGVAALTNDRERAERLGRGALDALDSHHDWRRAAQRTLALLDRLDPQ